MILHCKQFISSGHFEFALAEYTSLGSVRSSFRFSSSLELKVSLVNKINSSNSLWLGLFFTVKSDLKTIHNAFRGCRVQLAFFQQPFLKQLYWISYETLWINDFSDWLQKEINNQNVQKNLALTNII